jgi:hypothetical protein
MGRALTFHFNREEKKRGLRWSWRGNNDFKFKGRAVL